MKNYFKNQSGYIVSIITFFILVIMSTMAFSMGSLIFYSQEMSTNAKKSTQSYYAAESGIEDALLRLRNSPNIPSSTYALAVSSATVTVTIPDLLAGSRTITATSDNSGTIKAIKVVSTLDSSGVSFHYAIQSGGGFSLGSNSEIMGNIFANGDISNPNASATIDEGVVTTSTNKIVGHNNGNKLVIKKDAKTYDCSYATVSGNLTITGGNNTCGSASSASQVSNQPLPISQSQIDSWKNSASSACDSSDVTRLAGNGNTVSLGPCKVTGDLSIGNGSTLTIKGNLYVTGNITFGNKSNVFLDSSFGYSSGEIITDGTLTVSNNVTVKSLAYTGSGIIFLSTNSSTTAINIQNGGTVDGATLYASSGGISLNNNAHLHQITAAKTISLGTNIVLQYDAGLVNSFFTTGPSGSLKVTSWGEQ